MRGASAAKRAFDLRCLDVRVEAKGNSLRSLPSSGALRHLLPQAGAGLGWPGFARGPRFGENGGPARARWLPYPAATAARGPARGRPVFPRTEPTNISTKNHPNRDRKSLWTEKRVTVRVG